MPRVTVIVPAHNSAGLLEQALRSVMAQGYRDWEAIVVDDASSDDTLARAQGLGDPRITALRSEANLGPAGARNLAAQHARGELVALLDADDWWLPEYLERQVGRHDAARAQGVDVGVVGCDARLVGPDGREQAHTFRSQLPPHDPPTLERLLRGNFLFVSSLFPRAAAEEVGWFSTDLFGTEDHDLWIRILETGRAAVLGDDVLAVYRVAAGSVSANLARMAGSSQRTLHRALGRGRLTPRQQRTALAELRYYRAMEAVAGVRFDRERPLAERLAGLAAEAPALAWVALTRVGHWRGWARGLRQGRGG
jgi:glycosyltransferase involved in cell wall biosynthesis